MKLPDFEKYHQEVGGDIVNAFGSYLGELESQIPDPEFSDVYQFLAEVVEAPEQIPDGLSVVEGFLGELATSSSVNS